MKFFTIITSIILVYGINNAFALTVEPLEPTITACFPAGNSCSSCTTYHCAAGYYGTATSASAGCTQCPSHATCVAGNDTTFRCNEGYYKSSTSCIACPSNATCPIGATSFTCDAGYYKISTSCTRCPSETNYDGTKIYGTTNGTGATSMTDCYMPANTVMTDATGTFTYTSNCYYDNYDTGVIGDHIGGVGVIDPVNPARP